MDYLEKIIEQQSRLDEELKRMNEASMARKEDVDKVYEKFMSAIEKNLIKWEKDIEEGKITDSAIINSVRAQRECYNAMREKESI